MFGNIRVMMCIPKLLGHQHRILQSKEVVRGFPSSFPVVPWKKRINPTWVSLPYGVQEKQKSAIVTGKGKSMEERRSVNQHNYYGASYIVMRMAQKNA